MNKYKNLTWGIIVLIVIAAAVVLIVLGNRPTTPVSDTTLTKADDHVSGNPDAAVTLVEYSDFQCPACGAYYPVLKQLNEAYANDIQFVYRHFPLSNLHPFALTAAQASEAADKQGKFWEMHDMIFENQENWTQDPSPRDTFISYAENLGLNRDQFIADLDDNSTLERVREDITLGNNASVSATPSFFINGQYIQNPQSAQEFEDVIQAAINNNAGSQN